MGFPESGWLKRERSLDIAADPAGVQNVKIAIDARVMADVLPFWQAILGCDFVEHL